MCSSALPIAPWEAFSRQLVEPDWLANPDAIVFHRPSPALACLDDSVARTAGGLVRPELETKRSLAVERVTRIELA